MRKCMVSLLPLIALVQVVMGASKTIVDVNMDNWPEGWYANDYKKVRIDNHQLHQGTGAMLIDSTKGENLYAYIDLGGFEIPKGSKLKVEYWGYRKSAGNNGLVTVDIELRPKDKSKSIWWFGPLAIGTSEVGKWVKKTGEYIVPKDIKGIKIMCLNYGKTKVWFDELKVWVELPANFKEETPQYRIVSKYKGAHTTITIGKLKDNVFIAELVDKSSGINCINPAIACKSNLWELTFARNHWGKNEVIKDGGSGIFNVRKTDKGEVVLFWKDLDLPYEPDSIDVEVVVGTTLQGQLSLKINVINRTVSWGVFSAKFPIIDGIKPIGNPKDDVILLPRSTGRLIRNPLDNLGSLGSGYSPGNSCTFQMYAYYDEPTGNGLYFSTNDGRGYGKAFHFGRSGSVNPAFVFWSVYWPENATVPKTGLNLPYNIIIDTFRGDWFTATQIYKKWAVRNIRGCAKGPLSKRNDYSPLLKQTCLWIRPIPVIDYVNGRDIIGELSPFYDGKYLQERQGHINPEKTFDRIRSVWEYFDRKPTVVWWVTEHWVDWFDVAHHRWVWREGVPETVRMIHSLGNVKVIPYFNVKRYDLNIKQWIATGAWKYRAIPRGYGYYDVSLPHSRAALICPYNQFMWNSFAEGVFRWVKGVDIDGAYLDELSTGTAALCFAPDHGHPLGGGKWWVDGNRKIIEAIKAKCASTKSDFPTIGEDVGEFYMDVNDGNLLFNINTEQVPAVIAIYHEFTTFIMRNLGKWYDPAKKGAGEDNLGEFVSKSAQILCWGVQPGVIRGDILEFSPSSADFFRKIVRCYDFFREFLQFGRMLRPPKVEGAKKISIRWETCFAKNKVLETSAVMPSAWESSEGKVGLFFVNISNDTQMISYEFPLERLGRHEIKVFEITRMIKEEVFSGSIFKDDMILKPRGIKVYIID